MAASRSLRVSCMVYVRKKKECQAAGMSYMYVVNRRIRSESRTLRRKGGAKWWDSDVVPWRRTKGREISRRLKEGSIYGFAGLVLSKSARYRVWAKLRKARACAYTCATVAGR